VKAEVLAIGSELLEPGRSETNAQHLTARLREIGIEVVARTTIADDRERLRAALAHALEGAEVVIATGGLGPTADDLTREAAAEALGLSLHRDASVLDALRARFASFGRVMAPVNEQQADVLEGAEVLPNRRGTAPGQHVLVDGRHLFLLPGPPREMEPMYEEQVRPRLEAAAGGRVLLVRVLKIAAMGESDVEQEIAPLYRTYTNPRTTILGGPGQVELHLTADGASRAEAVARLEDLSAGIRALLPGRVFSEDGSELNEVVGRLLLDRGVTLAAAESCTGGLLSARLTEVAGASRFLDRTFVTYSNQAKVEMLGVDAALIERAGAVSEDCARAMAEGALRLSGAASAVAVTGIAGPTGGTEGKPVGLVFVALEGAAGRDLRRAQFPGDRRRVRWQATQLALELLRRGLLRLHAA
jgi:nicotinamide-nucleotide amidase